MTAAALSISHFRWRTDTGTIDGAPTWGAAVDTAWNIANATGFMIAFCVQNSGTNASSSTTVKLQVSRNGGAFTDVTTSSTVAVTANVSSSADQASVAVSEVAGTGSFVAGKYSEVGTTGAGITISGSNYTNFVYGVSFNATQLFNGDRLQFKIVTVAGTSITATTIPTVTFTGGWLAADYDWELPNGRVARSFDVAIRSEPEVWQRSLALLYPPVAETVYQPQAPVFLAGWPAAATWHQPDPTPTAIFQEAAAALPFTPLDWPNPRGPYSWRADPPRGLNPNLPAIAPDTTNTTRAPLVLRRITRWRLQPDPTPSALFDPAAPFAPIAWPNPQRHGPRSGPLHFRPKPGEDVIAAPAAPFVPVTWANPQRLRDTFTAQIQPHRVVFSGLDTVYGAPGQVPARAWPNPRGPQHPIELRTFIQRMFLAPVGPVADPFRPIDWPNPLRHGARSGPLHFRPKPGEDVVPAAAPFAQVNWPLPAFPRQPVSIGADGVSLLVTAPVVPTTGELRNLHFHSTWGRLMTTYQIGG